ncbi:MAG: hypothetical protein IGQ88_03465 [Gloeomargaritaceae cyanobacterium C42_A2020_066]|nr:hypothetical protein [Gloeomargaritaceae cyanobacterium C42_A2020_066]
MGVEALASLVAVDFQAVTTDWDTHLAQLEDVDLPEAAFQEQVEGRGAGFLRWLQEHDISKSQAYRLMELAESADALETTAGLDLEATRHFSKQAFVETAQADPAVQQVVVDRARQGERVTRREVQQLQAEWLALGSELLPEAVREQAANQTLPPRYLAPLVRELEKLPTPHQTWLQEEVAEQPDVETVRQTTATARQLSRYLAAGRQVQVWQQLTLDLEQALAEALRLDCLSATADLVQQVAQMEQAAGRLVLAWRRIKDLTDRLETQTGASTPHLQRLLQAVTPLAHASITTPLGNQVTARIVIHTEKDD